ncbi:putative transcription activator [Legionella oakridgensis ATCC 33761 = DSM 21215]|uniref:Putative transcription activator n=2 Tax=Legionella oakridgensis TaxID=29423 RepID=W0BEA2_9GAMM|nr:putative transcription activator [Legionella oakridgensis ATCC 33761 = DSM 21215]
MLRVAEANVQKIYTHPFNRHLYRGTLSPLAFRHFVMQDQIYLHHFAKTLMVITKRLPHKEQQYKFERLATRMIRTEQTLLQKYLKPSPYLFFLPIQPEESRRSSKRIVCIFLTGRHMHPLPRPSQAVSLAFGFIAD